jgi:hypothetical protein
MKRCSVCKEEKPLSDFPSRRASQDGLSYFCRQCGWIKAREWRAANRERHRASVAVWQKANKGRVNERSKAWRERNRLRRAQSVKAWNERNQDKRAEAVARRRAKIFTPSWANKKRIAAFYTEAKRLEKETGIPHHVDHIVPLNSELVCGLHVETNLQVIPAKENVLKRNLAWPDMPDWISPTPRQGRSVPTT